MSIRTSTLLIDDGDNRRRGRRHVILLILIFCFIFLISYFGFRKSADFFPIIGGVIGALSSIAVIVGTYFSSKDLGPPLELLVWRAICDLGLAVRFMATTGFDLMVCGRTGCQTTNTQNEKNCYVASAMTQFFEMASEAWLFCVGIDLYLSMTQPFSSFKSRRLYYHILVWTYAVVYSLPTWADTSIFGFWNVSNEINDVAICWIQLGNNRGNITSISYKPWVMLYIPLAVIYGVCLSILVFAYFRLKKGIPRTLLHRMKALLLNAINITIYLSYWFVAGLSYGISYILLDDSRPSSAKFLFNALLYLISAKGFSSVLVWITLMNTDIGGNNSKEGQDTESLDLNNALRQEVLHFATLGIRCTARVTQKRLTAKPDAQEQLKSSTTSDDAAKSSAPVGDNGMSQTKSRHETTLKFNFGSSDDTILTDTLSLWFFVKLVFGMRREVLKISMILKQTKALASQASIQPNGSAVAVPPNRNTLTPSPFPDMRLSQRPTMLIGQFKQQQQIPGVMSPAACPLVVSPGIAMATISSGGADGSHHSNKGLSSEQLEWDESAAFTRAPEDTTQIPLTEKISNFFFPDAAMTYVEFTEFEPLDFRRVRIAAGVNDTDYISAFQTTIKERLSEGGASGAFFFFSKGEEFIAKSCTLEELDSLRSSASAYASYLEENNDSFISRIFGAYRLKIYSTSLNFFVMNNIFLNSDNAEIHEKYDIKGSWVARNAAPPRNRQTATCTHCSQRFTYERKEKQRKNRGLTMTSTEGTQSGSAPVNGGSGPLAFLTKLMAGVRWSTGQVAVSVDEGLLAERCRETVNGIHEPNVVLKDNDLKYKLRLPRETAVSVLNQLRKDADFLYSIRVMDFSLLMGVHNTEYEVQPDNGSVNGSFDYGDNIENSKSFDAPPSVMSVDSTIHSLDGAIQTVSRNLHRVNTIIIPPRENSAKQGGNSRKVLIGSKKILVSRVVGPESYYMGIIDYQQRWTWQKKLERFLKINFVGADPDGLSAIEPRTYRDRFVRHLEDILGLGELFTVPTFDYGVNAVQEEPPMDISEPRPSGGNINAMHL